MQIRQFRFFRTVGEELHFAHAAAQRWFQPSLSRIPRRFQPLFGQEINKSADPKMHRVAQDAHKCAAAQFVGDVLGLAQQIPHPGYAPCPQSIAIVAAQIPMTSITSFLPPRPLCLTVQRFSRRPEWANSRHGCWCNSRGCEGAPAFRRSSGGSTRIRRLSARSISPPCRSTTWSLNCKSKHCRGSRSRKAAMTGAR